ncbi:GNAT family N-acetyltransferase [Lysobacter auxotrophicus]|uniref:GNAT family N-acetyltransferase n=1 Tax=Lysobacter auxotrophicus TaxID=2992573 RepID=A0ABN6ULJ0_9GAMM|nr:GNAT family N-acetyltransferase [Lysobacter auxotrophicus]BDU17161.1 GNAT family N-acetyltransferase [Lysobacter auxotrophicus]
MADITNASELETHRICEGLQAFNRAVVGSIESTPIQLAARDEAGELLGGIVGDVLLGWLEIHVLWLRDDARAHGHGAALLHACERRAMQVGAHSARLDTFDWQAEAFYRRHGYERFAVLDRYPDAHTRVFMRKSLATD